MPNKVFAPTRTTRWEERSLDHVHRSIEISASSIWKLRRRLFGGLLLLLYLVFFLLFFPAGPASVWPADAPSDPDVAITEVAPLLAAMGAAAIGQDVERHAEFYAHDAAAMFIFNGEPTVGLPRADAG